MKVTGVINCDAAFKYNNNLALCIFICYVRSIFCVYMTNHTPTICLVLIYLYLDQSISLFWTLVCEQKCAWRTKKEKSSAVGSSELEHLNLESLQATHCHVKIFSWQDTKVHQELSVEPGWPITRGRTWALSSIVMKSFGPCVIVPPKQDVLYLCSSLYVSSCCSSVWISRFLSEY